MIQIDWRTGDSQYQTQIGQRKGTHFIEGKLGWGIFCFLSWRCFAWFQTELWFSPVVVQVRTVVWGIASLLSKEQGLKVQVSVVYCSSGIRCAQDAKALVSRAKVIFSLDSGSRWGLNRGWGYCIMWCNGLCNRAWPGVALRVEPWHALHHRCISSHNITAYEIIKRQQRNFKKVLLKLSWREKGGHPVGKRDHVKKSRPRSGYNHVQLGPNLLRQSWHFCSLRLDIYLPQCWLMMPFHSWEKPLHNVDISSTTGIGWFKSVSDDMSSLCQNASSPTDFSEERTNHNCFTQNFKI